MCAVRFIYSMVDRVRGVKTAAEKSTLCEKLKGPDFLPDAKLQDLLQDVLPLAFLHDAHSLQLSVCQSHQSPP